MKWGVWGRRLDAAQMLRLIEESAELGITTFDHADIYGDYTTEAEFGEALKLRPQLRQGIQLISKCGICVMTSNRPQHRLKSYNTSALHIRRSVEQSLRNLHTDYLDVLLIHRPDPLLHPDEVAGIFQTLQQEGKVLHFGVSNFSPSQMAVLQAKFPLVTNQVKASAMHLAPFTDGTFDQCLRYGIRPMAWSPLGGERFFTEPDDPQAARVRRACAAVAAAHGDVGEDQIMVAFLLRHPAGIVPVIGTGNMARVRAAANALRIPLTREEWFEIWSASTGTEVD